jgi:succinate dehydrogenase/fumarate reductase flavoprotein subunit
MVNPITVLEDFRVIDLLTAKNRCIGGIGIDVKSGEIISILSKAVVIATGGWQTAYHTGGSDELAGDGQAMAFRAGVELIDMEMTTFMDRYLIQPPFASRDNFVWNWNISREITNSLNEKILSEKHEKTDSFKKLELLSKEITYNRSSEEAGLSLKNPRKTLRNGYFHLKDIFTEQDYTDFNFEITIGCHYCSGGIRVNEKTETNLKGLYVAGEASGGLFGARRIASALTEAAVQGTLAGRNSIDCSENPIVKPKKEAILKIIDRIEKPLKNKDGIKPSDVFSKMKKLSSKYLTLYRTEALLKTVVANLSKMNSEFLDNLCCSYDGRTYNKEWMDSLSLTNLTLCLEATAKSALLRRETRGFHRRIDYPDRNDREWLKNIIIKNVASETCAEAIPIVSI